MTSTPDQNSLNARHVSLKLVGVGNSNKKSSFTIVHCCCAMIKQTKQGRADSSGSDQM